MWVADWLDEKIYAYDLNTQERLSGRDFNFLKAATNWSPIGIWSDGTTMWVVDSSIAKVFAYDMATTARDTGREFDVLDAAGNLRPRGIWSDGMTTWVSDSEDAKIYAYHKEGDALAALYDAAGGAGWTKWAGWLTEAPVGEWHGVTTDAEGRVSGLDLQDNALSGRIPVELGSLTNLEELRLNDNELTGEIPNALGFLENLAVLHLAGNPLTGCVPTALMDVADNDFDELGLAVCPPATAARAFSATVAPPGGQVTVSITAADYGDDGQVTETLPPGFAYVSGSLPEDRVTVSGQAVEEVTFELAGETSFTYVATASGREGIHTFSGAVQDSEGNEYPVGGGDMVSVSMRDWLLLRFDADGNGSIDIGELFTALEDYFAGGINVSQLFGLIDLYFEGPAEAS